MIDETGIEAGIENLSNAIILQMECHAYLQPAVANILEDAAAPLLAKHDYRNIKIDSNTTVTIDLEDIKKRLAEDFYRSQGIGLV